MRCVLLPTLMMVLLAGCGAEVAGTAAVGAQTQVEQAKQARALQDQVQRQLDAAQQAQTQKLQDTESAARP